MKVTLRNKATGEFLCAGGRWGNSGLQAFDFGAIETAQCYRRELGLREVDVFIIYDDPDRNQWHDGRTHA
jgi:hypothetical protein